MRRRPIDDAANDIQAVLAPGKRHRRFCLIFSRQRCHRLGIHIGWIRHNHVIAGVQFSEYVALMKLYAIL